MPEPRCAYCGKRAKAAVCAAHRDLPALDPGWNTYMATSLLFRRKPNRPPSRRMKKCLRCGGTGVIITPAR